MWFRQYYSQMKRAGDSSTSTKGLALESRYGGGPAKTALFKRLQKPMFIATLRSNIRFKVDGYETHVTLDKKKLC